MDKHEGHGPDVTVTVFSPREPDPRPFTWPKSKKVGEAAKEAAQAFGYEAGNPSFQNAAGVVLDRNKPLAGEHVKDGDRLDLVDVGGGV
jgi:hypothetical protein